MSITNSESLELFKLVFKKWAELICKDIDKDLDRLDELDMFDQYYVRAVWQKRADSLFKITKYIEFSDDPEVQYKMIMEVFFPESIEASEVLKGELAERLKWMKSKIAKDYEKSVISKINFHNVTSPIEQIFLMEWEYHSIGKKYEVTLLPQASLNTNKGTYIIDFVVSKKISKSQTMRIAIELDGHEFHEKNKSQVMADERRERAIVTEGLPVLRFSGSEIVRNPRSCVVEIAEYIGKNFA